MTPPFVSGVRLPSCYWGGVSAGLGAGEDSPGVTSVWFPGGSGGDSCLLSGSIRVDSNPNSFPSLRGKGRRRQTPPLGGGICTFSVTRANVFSDEFGIFFPLLKLSSGPAGVAQ